jgi:hypothetical protein
MATRRKKKRKRGRKPASEVASKSRAQAARESAGGGLLQGMRQSFKQIAGAEETKKRGGSSTLWNVLSFLLLVGAIALFLYRWTR